MSVKKKDRHVSKRECLGKSRELMNFILILTRPREFDKDGKQTQKPGLLGEGQPLLAFGSDILTCGKCIHAACYNACEINLRDRKSLDARNKLHEQTIRYCDSLFRLIDLCIFQYAKNNKKKRRSFEHLARLVKAQKDSLYDRMNRDKLIYEQKYEYPRMKRRGR